MPALVTLQTRLTDLFQEARAIKQFCREAYEAMEAGPVSSNSVLGLAQRFRASIDQIVVPSQNHPGLAAEAARQFNDPAFGLDVRMAGLKSLMENSIAIARELIPTDPVSGCLLKDTWHPDGSVSVLPLASVETAALCQILRIIHDNIPE